MDLYACHMKRDLPSVSTELDDYLLFKTEILGTDCVYTKMPPHTKGHLKVVIPNGLDSYVKKHLIAVMPKRT